MQSAGSFPFFELRKEPAEKIATLYLNRPEKRNAMHWPFWRDLPLIVKQIEEDPEIRVCIVAGHGKSFTTGLDFEPFFAEFGEKISADTGDGRLKFYEFLKVMQSGMNAIAEARTIFIAAVHRHCIGGGLDLIAACDLRLASADASFSLRETRVAIVADMGSLARLPGLIGQSATRYLALTGADIGAGEALRIGLLNFVLPDQTSLMTRARELALEIAANSWPAVSGTKAMLNYAQDHGVKENLDHVLLYNAAFLDTLDLREMLRAFQEKRRPRFV